MIAFWYLIFAQALLEKRGPPAHIKTPFSPRNFFWRFDIVLSTLQICRFLSSLRMYVRKTSTFSGSVFRNL
jgi:hypothetical protein